MSDSPVEKAVTAEYGADGHDSTFGPPSKRANKYKNQRPKRVRPNAFVSLQITNPTVKSKMAAIQEQMISNEDSIKSLEVSKDTFHLTTMVIRLDEKTQLSESQAALEESARAVGAQLSSAVFELDKISNFNNNVVFVTISDEDSVQLFKDAAGKIREIFASHGLPCTDDRESKPHVTLFKGGVIPRVTYSSIEDTNCGSETFQSLQLCSMSKPKQDSGYYHIIQQVELSSPAADNSNEETNKN